MLKRRILTALVLIPLVIYLIDYAPDSIFAPILVLIVGYAAWEWSSLLKLVKASHRLLYCAVVLLCLFGFYYLPIHFVLKLSLFVWLWLAAALYCYNRESSPLGLNQVIVRALLGCFMLPVFALSLWTLREPRFGAWWIVFLLVVVWSTDTGAYFAGRFFGKTPLAARISPKKTLAGLWGGLLLALVAAWVFSYFLPLAPGERPWVLFSAFLVSILSVIGDLVESVLKRMAGVKDSGQLFPGHGGLLDRFDSLFAAIPLFALLSHQLGLM